MTCLYKRKSDKNIVDIIKTLGNAVRDVMTRGGDFLARKQVAEADGIPLASVAP